ncbi:MAG: glycoside hydrolase family 10 protein [Candidatus Gastranaerophilaceae bacterium]
MMKFIRFFSIVFLILFLFAIKVFAADVFSEYSLDSNEVVFQKSTYKVNSIDPTPETNWMGASYPGVRGANQLVVYTQNFGISTGTNEFGAEAVVENNTVTSLSGADSLIPTNGIVISAHGRAKTWLNKNVHVGTKIYIDRNAKTITAITTSESYIFAAKEKIEEATTMMNYYQRNALNYNSKPTKELINLSKQNLRKAKRDSMESKDYALKAMDYANNALATAIPYKESELRGIWIRPTNTSRATIVATIERLNKIGINNVFLETFYHGRTIFPSYTMDNYGFISQNPAFKGIDPLKIWIEEAHKRNMKVNIWFEAFYIGNKPQMGKEILAVKPEWSNVNLRNADTDLPVASSSEHNGYFLDPANPEVQTFLQSLVSEIIKTYRPDGFNFDYCRYPQSVYAKHATYAMSNWGYTKYAREEFKSLYNYDPVDLKFGTKLWYEWDNYRRDKVTSFIESVSKLCRQNHTIITAVVFPNKNIALETKQQDWSTWSDKNYIDGFTPLYLTCDANTIKSMIFEMLREMSPKTKLYAGLFVTFMDGSAEDLIRQIHETRKLNLGGVILFDLAHLQEKYVKTLTTSVFSNSACSTIQVNSTNCKRKKYDRG